MWVPLKVMDCSGSGWFCGFEEKEGRREVSGPFGPRGVGSTTNGLGHQVASLAGLEVQLSPGSQMPLACPLFLQAG